jgi:hypothetical protein
MLFQPESDLELNRKYIENFLIFLTVISTSQYDKRFRSYDFLKLTGLIRFEQFESFTLLGLVQVQYQKTCNTKLVANFLKFPVIAHMLKSNKQRRSCAHWNTVHKRMNLEYRF